MTKQTKGKRKVIIFIIVFTLLGGVSMAKTVSEQELFDALKDASKYLECSNDPVFNDLVYRPLSVGLREAADKIDRKDADIRHIREVIKKYE